MKIMHCFRIEKGAGLGVDSEGNPCEVYTRVSAEVCKDLTPEELQANQEAFKKLLAFQIGIDENHVTSITRQEYSENVEEEQ
jgi:hypothetical protein